ncbi:MAG: metalloregulator ArsR/SmtB family transcription factor [Minwuia sp.]|nr:metalloregulator ArsR/SmtB family transcription factor [Minwuia sp.]
MIEQQHITLGSGRLSPADRPTHSVMSMPELVLALKAASDDTRLTLLALCRRSELTVSELVAILGQSQPRVSRHLKLLCDAGLLERTREGAWVYYRLALSGAHAALATMLDDLIQSGDPALATQLARLDQVRQQRAARAQEYFSRNAAHWDEVRRLHVSEREVETALHAILGTDDIDDLLDLGTGTGRLLSVLAGRVSGAIGVDLNPEMLSIARSALDSPEYQHVQVRHGDILRLPFAAGSFDLVTAHQVMHFMDEPRQMIAGAAAMLRPGGRLVIIDFLSHDHDELRSDHAHRRLGFDDAELGAWFTETGLTPEHTLHLPGRTLTVGLWSALRPALDQEA